MLIKGTFLLVLCSSNNVNLLGSLNTENDQLYTHFDTCTQIDFYYCEQLAILLTIKLIQNILINHYFERNTTYTSHVFHSMRFLV